MTVQNEVVKNTYIGNGSTTVFPITFGYDGKHPEYIHVYIGDKGTGLVTETDNYKLDVSANNVMFPKDAGISAVLSTNETLTIMREVPYRQELNLVNHGPFFAENIELTLDDIVRMIQQLKEQIVRTLKIPLNYSGTDFKLDVPVEAGKTFRFSDDGTRLEATDDPAKVKIYVDGKCVEAAGSANVAATCASNASTSATSASTSETNAKTSETAAKKSETAAATSANAAAISEQNAAASKEAVGLSKTAAALSEKNAATSATAAATSANEAAISEQNAAASKEAAGLSKTAAALSERNAATSANESAKSLMTATVEADRAKAEADKAASIVGGDYISRTEASKVALSGSYTDLLNVPRDFIPSVHRHDASEITNLPTCVLLSDVGNIAGKIPKYTADGHLMLPDGTEIWVAPGGGGV